MGKSLNRSTTSSCGKLKIWVGGDFTAIKEFICLIGQVVGYWE
jgi:hypothetical protein